MTESIPFGKNGGFVAVKVEFTCELQVDNREQFQREGHMLFSLYTPNPRAGFPDILRQWEGENVYALRLMYKGKQVHRVLSDSLEDATRLMAEGLKNDLFALFASQFARGFDREQHDLMLKERSDFAQWIVATFKEEIEAGTFREMANPFELAASLIQHYRKEK